MAIKIHIPTPMRQYTDDKTTVEVAGDTVAAVLADLSAKYPALGDRLFQDGKVRQFINIFVNSDDVRYLNDLATPVKDGDEVDLMSALAGG